MSNVRGIMHTGNLATSKRLQAIHKLLIERGLSGATGREISAVTGALNPATEVSALRHNGISVNCEFLHTLETGSKVYKYWIPE